ncbi:MULTISPECIES: oxalurate catabolism protein HpxX [Pantoea]|uniref:Oxalurate catabolism protein HpxX n=1 Tax=Candidatus Pantoea multigeneris TaxID=2608357 RepID=A0ABX0RDU1_9GAMM|nr:MULTISPECIES: oxalurate catabolism protein HpxX [Pantoea]NIF23525.1 oxalurate catabolism protein HpxX [Pantoea multigeneris]
MTQQTDWAAYIAQMEQILDLELDESRRAELRVQFERIAGLAAPLMAVKLDDRLEVAGVFNPCN